MGQYMVGNPVEITETFRILDVPTDPTTVTFNVRSGTGVLTSYVFGTDMEVTNPSVGVYLLTIVPQVSGEWLYEAIGTGAVVARSSTGNFTVDDSAVVPTGPPPLNEGPCSSWVDGQDIAECCAAASNSVGTTDFESLEPFALQASDLLFSLSGRQYAGICSQTVRPCQTTCFGGLQVLSRGYVVHPSWGGYGWWWDQGSFCGCSPLSSVDLAGYPVRQITQVKIDGAVINPDTYRLDQNRKAVRLDDPATGERLWWPACQDFGAPDTEPGTFSITYQYGQAPPPSGIAAACELACQLWLRANGSDECSLPDGVTRVTRQGVTFERQAFISWSHQGGQSRSLVYGWHTGLAAVDLFLNAKNPSGLRRRPTVMSPDTVGRYAPNVGS